MSFHYEVVFATFLRDDTPPEVLDELRYHLGFTEDRPQHLAIDYDFPVLQPDEDSYLPGGDHVALRRQYRGRDDKGEHHAWGLHVRCTGWTTSGLRSGGRSSCGSLPTWRTTATRATSASNTTRA